MWFQASQEEERRRCHHLIILQYLPLDYGGVDLTNLLVACTIVSFVHCIDNKGFQGVVVMLLLYTTAVAFEVFFV